MKPAVPRGTFGWVAGSRGPGRLLVAGAALYTLLYLVWQVAGWGGAEHRVLINNIARLPLQTLSVVLAVWVARTPTFDRRTRRAWLLIGLAYACLWIGNFLWLLYESVLHREPFPSPADAGYLAFYPLLFVGLLLFPQAPRARGDRTKFLLDAATVFVGSSMLIWYLVLRPVASESTGGWFFTALTLAYPTGDLVLILGLATVLLREPAPGSARPLQVLIAGVAIQVVADLLFAYLSLEGVYESAGLADSLYLTEQFFLTLAAYKQLTQPRTAGEATRSRSGRISLLPYAAVAIGYALLIARAPEERSWSLLGLILGAAALTALVVARQVVALRENARLLEEIGQREARFRSLIQNASDIIVVIDDVGTVQFISPAVEQALGYEADALLGRTIGDAVHLEDLARVRQLVQDGALTLGPMAPLEMRVRHADGAWRTFEVHVTDCRADPGVRGIVINARHISERKALEGLLRHQAYHDPLTGLPNRTHFVERLKEALQQAGDQSGMPAVIFLDLDGFKMVNDSLGHPAGDALLRQVAERLNRLLRPGDTVARFGGDEFTVMLDHVAHPEAALQAGERICAALSKPFALLGREIEIGVSAGIVVPDRREVEAEELLRRADIALYQAKARGKRRAVLFDPLMEEHSLERLTLAAELRRALDEGSLHLEYQPEVDLHTGAVRGVEALLRWTHPTLGRIAPETFVPLAEETGLILPIGCWVLEEACRQARAWESLRPDGPPLVMSVNLSARQFARPELVREVARVLHQTEVEPRALRLELTEGVLSENAETAQQTLAALTRLGVRLALDGFGTGYSSLGYLHRFAVDSMKIGPSFVQQIDADARRRAVVQGITATAHALAMDVTAEGLESPAQVESVRALGCDRGQGDIFAPPLPPDEVEPFLRPAYRARVRAGAPSDS